MKKIILLSLCLCIAAFTHAQNWTQSLNIISGTSPNFGTKSNDPIYFYTNNTKRMTLTSTGALKLDWLMDGSYRFLQMDGDGNLTKWNSQASDSEKVLFGDGSFRKTLFKTSGNTIFTNTSAKLGIGTTNPAVQLDVNGAGNFSSNLSVGGTLAAASRIEYAGSFRSEVIPATSTTPLTFRTVPNLGTTTVPNYPTHQYKQPCNVWYKDPNNGQTMAIWNPVVNQPFYDLIQIAPSSNVTAVMSIGMLGSDGIITAETLPNMAPTTHTALKLNPTCSNDVRICEGGGYTYIFNGAYVGSDLTVAHDAIVTHNVTAANDVVSSHNVTASNDISATHDLNASNNANISNLLKVGGNLQSNSSIVTIGQATKGNPALTLTDNTSTTNQDFFKVYGNGYTEIDIYSPSTTARALAIRDNVKDLFVVKSNGKAYAREMEISNLASFPDYVFNSEYKLKPIAELDNYIQQNKHLPGFEKGSYYEQNGINVNDMFVKQQEKIEELTLYIIQLEKRLKSLEGQK